MPDRLSSFFKIVLEWQSISSEIDCHFDEKFHAGVRRMRNGNTNVARNNGIGAVIVGLVCMFHCGFGNVFAWQSDNGDGTFSNPVLYADFPDPDIIRVDTNFYMVSTTLAGFPGISVFRSQDMVNWEIIFHTATTLNGSGAYNTVDGAPANSDVMVDSYTKPVAKTSHCTAGAPKAAVLLQTATITVRIVSGELNQLKKRFLPVMEAR